MPGILYGIIGIFCQRIAVERYSPKLYADILAISMGLVITISSLFRYFLLDVIIKSKIDKSKGPVKNDIHYCSSRKKMVLS